jgi:hypothetical protein
VLDLLGQRGWSYLENCEEDGQDEQVRPIDIVPQDAAQTDDLSHQNGDGDDELVHAGNCSSKTDWRDFGQVHGTKTRVEPTVHSDHQSTNDHHLDGVDGFRHAHQDRGDSHQDVIEEEAVLGAEFGRYDTTKEASDGTSHVHYRRGHPPQYVQEAFVQIGTV